MSYDPSGSIDGKLIADAIKDGWIKRGFKLGIGSLRRSERLRDDAEAVRP